MLNEHFPCMSVSFGLQLYLSIKTVLQPVWCQILTLERVQPASNTAQPTRTPLILIFSFFMFNIWSTQNKRWMKMNLVHFCDKEFHVHMFCIKVLWNLTIYHFKMITNSLFKVFCLFIFISAYSNMGFFVL